jgi:HEAT repeat protein
MADDDPWVRAVVVSALAELKAVVAVPKLTEMLRGSNPMLRGAAATALAQIGERSAIRPLAGAFAVTGDRAMEAALVALDADWRNSAEASGLARQLLAKLDPVVATPAPHAPPRKVVTSTIPQQSERAREKAKARAQQVEREVGRLANADASVREAAVKSMGAIKDRAAIGPLVRTLADSSPKVRRLARSVLDALDGRWTAAHECHAQRDYLLSRLALGGELYWDVLRVLEAIDPKWAEYKSARAAIPHLAVASTGEGEFGWHPDRTPPGHARRLLEQIDRNWQLSREAKVAVPALVGLFAEASMTQARVDRTGALLDRIETGWRAHDACGEVVSRLLPLVADEKAPVERRLPAIHALGWLGDPRATTTLVATLAAASLRDAAIVAIGRCGDKLAVPSLLSLSPSEGRARLALATSLGQLKVPEGISQLLRILTVDRDFEEEVVDRLEALLTGDCAWIDEADLRALAGLVDFSFNKLTEDWTTEEIGVSCRQVREAAAQELARRRG